MDILTINPTNFTADTETLEAQRQWLQDGTISIEYLKHVLGDISKGVSVFAPPLEQQGNVPNACTARTLAKSEKGKELHSVPDVDALFKELND